MSNAEHICPNCGKEAENEDEIEALFGYRNFRGSVYNQSWCKECR